MASHSYTLLNLQNAVLHALGKNPSDSGYTTATEIVNDALAFLSAYHSWSWRTKAASLNFTANQEYIVLPADFAQVQSLRRASTFADAIGVTIDEITAWRQQTTIGNLGDLYYAVGYLPQASVTLLPSPKIDIYPKPTANETAALSLVYTRIIPKLTNTTDVPDLPPQWHPVLKSLCRAFAISDEDEMAGVDWDRFNTHILRLIDEDAGNQSNIGPMNGDVPRRDFRGLSSPFLNPAVTY